MGVTQKDRDTSHLELEENTSYSELDKETSHFKLETEITVTSQQIQSTDSDLIAEQQKQTVIQ